MRNTIHGIAGAMVLAVTVAPVSTKAASFGAIPIEEEDALAMQIQADLTIAMMNQYLVPLGYRTPNATVTGSFTLDDSTPDPFDGTAEQELVWNWEEDIIKGIDMRLRGYFDSLEYALIVEMEGEGVWTGGMHKGTPFEVIGLYKEYDDNTALIDIGLYTESGEGDGYVYGTLEKTKANDRLVAVADDLELLYMRFEFDQTDGSFTSLVRTKEMTWTHAIRNSGKLGGSNLDYEITNVPLPPAGLLLGAALMLPVAFGRRRGAA